MSNPLAARTKIDPKAINPITSKKGTFAISKLQCDYFLRLLGEIPSKGSFAVHKARVVAVAGPQIQDWETCRIDLVKEHALTELINAETPEAGVRVLTYTKEEVDTVLGELAKVGDDAAQLGKPNPPAVAVPTAGEAKFADDAARLAFQRAYEALIKDMLIVWDVGSQANIRKALAECVLALSGERCPLILDMDIFAFERLLEELEVSLS